MLVSPGQPMYLVCGVISSLLVSDGGDASVFLQGDFLNPDISKWDVKEVCKWLRSRGLKEHVQDFEKNDITGSLLLRIGKYPIFEHLRSCPLKPAL